MKNITEGNIKNIDDNNITTAVSTEIPDQLDKLNKEDDRQFQEFEVLYKDVIDMKCKQDYGTISDEKLWKDAAKELFLQSKDYILQGNEFKSKEVLQDKEKKLESKTETCAVCGSTSLDGCYNIKGKKVCDTCGKNKSLPEIEKKLGESVHKKEEANAIEFVELIDNLKNLGLWDGKDETFKDALAKYYSIKETDKQLQKEKQHMSIADVEDIHTQIENSTDIDEIQYAVDKISDPDLQREVQLTLDDCTEDDNIDEVISLVLQTLEDNAEYDDNLNESVSSKDSNMQTPEKLSKNPNSNHYDRKVTINRHDDIDDPEEPLTPVKESKITDYISEEDLDKAIKSNSLLKDVVVSYEVLDDNILQIRTGIGLSYYKAVKNDDGKIELYWIDRDGKQLGDSFVLTESIKSNNELISKLDDPQFQYLAYFADHLDDIEDVIDNCDSKSKCKAYKEILKSARAFDKGRSQAKKQESDVLEEDQYEAERRKGRPNLNKIAKELFEYDDYYTSIVSNYSSEREFIIDNIAEVASEYNLKEQAAWAVMEKIYKMATKNKKQESRKIDDYGESIFTYEEIEDKYAPKLINRLKKVLPDYDWRYRIENDRLKIYDNNENFDFSNFNDINDKVEEIVQSTFSNKQAYIEPEIPCIGVICGINIIDED